MCIAMVRVRVWGVAAPACGLLVLMCACVMYMRESCDSSVSDERNRNI